MTCALARLSRLAGGSFQSPSGGAHPELELLALARPRGRFGQHDRLQSGIVDHGCASRRSTESSAAGVRVVRDDPRLPRRPRPSTAGAPRRAPDRTDRSARPAPRPRRQRRPARSPVASAIAQRAARATAGGDRAHGHPGEYEEGDGDHHRRARRPRRTRPAPTPAGRPSRRPPTLRTRRARRSRRSRPASPRPGRPGRTPPAGGASRRSRPGPARAGNARPSDGSSPRPISMRTPTAMSTGGRRNRPQPEQVAHAHPGIVAGRAERTVSAVEGDGAQDAQRDQGDAPQIGGVFGGDRAHRRQQPARLPGMGTGPPVAPSALAGLVLLRGDVPARSRRGCRLALGPRCPGSTRRTLGGGRHSGHHATAGMCRPVGHPPGHPRSTGDPGRRPPLPVMTPA